MGFLDFMSDVFGAGWSWLAGQQGAGLSYKHQKKLLEQQYDLNMKGSKELSKWNALNSSSYLRQGLEKAGFNPLLVTNATGQGASSFSAGSAPSSAVPDFTNAFNSQTQRRLANAQVDSTNAQASLFDEQAKTEEAKRVQMDFQNAMLDVEKHLKQKDLDTYDRRFYSQLYEQMQRAENYRALTSVVGYNAESQRIASNAQMVGSQAKQSDSVTNRYLAKYGTPQRSILTLLNKPKTKGKY